MEGETSDPRPGDIRFRRSRLLFPGSLAVSAWKILATDNHASPENLIPDHPNRSISKHQHECNGPNLTCANLLRQESTVLFVCSV
jgi:hypothetical protein